MGLMQRMTEGVQKALGYEVGEPTPELIAHNRSNTEWWGAMLLSGVVGAVAFEIDRQVGMYMEDRLSRGPASAATSGSLGMPALQSVILGDLSHFLKELDPNLPQRSDEAFRIARDLMKYEAALHQGLRAEGLRAEGLRAEDGKMDELVESLRTLRGKLITSEPGLRSSIANAQAIVSDMQR